jgi:recombination protein RecT
MSTTLERRVAEPQQPTIYQTLEKMRPQIARAVPRHIDPDRMLRMMFTELRETPELSRAPMDSLLGALMTAAQLGLEIGNKLGHVYLIPRRIKGQPEIVFVIGYRGLVDLAFRSGMVRELSALCVWRGEPFAWRAGDDPRIEHEPDPDADAREENFRCAYAIGKLTTGGTERVVIGRRHIARARQGSAIGEGKGPWASDWEAMVSKTAIRRLAALLPLSAEMRGALVMDERPAVPMLPDRVLSIDEAAARVSESVVEVEPEPVMAQAPQMPAEPEQPVEPRHAPRQQRARQQRATPETQDEPEGDPAAAPAESEAASGQVEDAEPGGTSEQPASSPGSQQASTMNEEADAEVAAEATLRAVLELDSDERSALASRLQRLGYIRQDEQLGECILRLFGPRPSVDALHELHKALLHLPERARERDLAAEFERDVIAPAQPDDGQLTMIGEGAAELAMDAALRALSLQQRQDLGHLLIAAGHVGIPLPLTGAQLRRLYPELEPTPHALLALRDRLAAETQP